MKSKSSGREGGGGGDTSSISTEGLLQQVGQHQNSLGGGRIYPSSVQRVSFVKDILVQPSDLNLEEKQERRVIVI